MRLYDIHSSCYFYIPMRFTAFILAMLVLIMNCLPCADQQELILAEKHAHTAPAPHDHQEHTDLCSPFCHCACCATFLVVHQPLILSEKQETLLRPPYSTYLSQKIAEVSLPIWQPPQLV